MNSKQNTDAFLAALLKHCSAAEVMVLRNPGGPDESPSSVHTLHQVRDIEWLRGWLWHENASKSKSGQVYVRPAPGEDHPWLFLDDVPRRLALSVARKYAALIVETSPGNCQIRILASRSLSDNERTDIQRDLADRFGADMGSVAGTKWGRLPGYKNRKPGRDECWTNLLLDTTTTGSVRKFLVLPPLPAGKEGEGGRGLHIPRTTGGAEGQQGQHGYIEEFAFVCHRLRDGADVGQIISLVADHALRRGKRRTRSQALKYAERTVAAALRRFYSERPRI